MNQISKAEAFRDLHTGAPLVLANVWDPMSARLVEQSGAAAIATTSSGVSWAAGRRDGESLDRGSAIRAITSIVDAVSVPVSADIERGYGDGSPAAVAETIREVVAAGAVGVNLEDTPGLRRHQAQIPLRDQVRRIEAARMAADETGVALFINARIDTYLRSLGDPSERLAATIERAGALVAAGADGVFVPGVIDPSIIVELAAAIPAPLNILAGAGAPTVGDLGEMGVARISVGPAVALAAARLVSRASHEVINEGTYGALEDALSFRDAQELFNNHNVD